MIPDGEVLLFVATLKRQAGGDMCAGLSGRIEAAGSPSLHCPAIDSWGQPWRELAPGMHSGMVRWSDEGTIPPVRVVLHWLRTHPEAHFFEALAALDADRTAGALAALVSVERAALRLTLSEPAAQEWLARRRREALGQLDGPLPCDREHAAEALGILATAGAHAGRSRGTA